MDSAFLYAKQALFSAWISRFGVPSVITSDRGAQFVSGIWTSLCSILGIRHSTTTSYHPQANGLVKRFHRQLKDALSSRLAGSDWFYHLPWILLGLRVAPKKAQLFPPPNSYMDAPCPCLENFWMERSLRRIRSSTTSQPPLPKHNIQPTVPTVPPSLLSSKYVFV